MSDYKPIQKHLMEKFIKSGRPLTFCDPNIVPGKGTQYDFPNGLPIGSYFRGTPICGADNEYGIPCTKKPLRSGRCSFHTNPHRINKQKKQEKSTYNNILTPDEVKLYNKVSTGTLVDEIKVFRLLLRRQLEVYNPNDPDAISSLVQMVETLRKLEMDQFKLQGSKEALVASDLISELRLQAKEVDTLVPPKC